MGKKVIEETDMSSIQILSTTIPKVVTDFERAAIEMRGSSLFEAGTITQMTPHLPMGVNDEGGPIISNNMSPKNKNSIISDSKYGSTQNPIHVRSLDVDSERSGFKKKTIELTSRQL